jgi:hypothetical protein
MKFAYEDLGSAVCQFVLGAATQGFATGPDGGRDAKFVGTAELLPSKTAPWNGTVIVQAKHTNAYNTTFSDAEFFSEKHDATVLGKELPRIKQLRATKNLDHYMLFSNRRLTGGAESKLRGHICKECSMPESSILLCGVEQLETWLKRFPDAARIADIDPIDSPLLVSPDDLAEVVEHLAAHLAAASPQGAPPTDRVTYEKKNKLNGLSADYAATLRKRYLKDTAAIRDFLAMPGNETVLARYESAIDEFELEVLAKKKPDQTFDLVLQHLFSVLFGRDPVLRKYPRLTRAVVFYMYWNCDLGLKDHASA